MPGACLRVEGAGQHQYMFFSRQLHRIGFLTVLLVAAGMIPADPGWAAPPDVRPNLILINLDDADADLLAPERLAEFFPGLNRFTTGGLRFTNFHVTTPLCGPSRACLLRGQYAHNTGIRTNDPYSDRSNGFGGGMRRYQEQGYLDDDLSVWLKQAGYRTMMVGKFLHGDTVNVVPPGWDDFYSSRGAEYYGTWRFTNRLDPQGAMSREDETAYRTRVESAEMLELIQRHAEQQPATPFFLYFAPLTPHNEAPGSPFGMIEKRYQDLWPDLSIRRTADFDERDLSDKSSAMRQVPRLNDHWLEYARQRNRYRHIAMKTVDDVVGLLLDQLEQLGLSENTWVLLTSDNGYCNGHHRLFGKSDAFNRSTNVPLYVLGPGIPAGVDAEHLLAHIDIAPTLVDLAGGRIPSFVDGRSFRPLLVDPESVPATDWRKAVLIENWERRNVRGVDYNFASLAARLFDSVYVEWASGTPEFYDLKSDPLQLQNTFAELSPERRADLARILKSLRRKSIPPDTTLSQPLFPGDVLKRDSPLAGMAEDDAGVRRVQLVIRRLSDYHCWNGQTWQPGYTRVDAQLANPGQPLTSWSYGPPAAEGNENIGVWAQACDVSGNCDPDPPWAIFRFDDSAPSSSITMPANRSMSSKLNLEGTATDERIVTSLRLVIRDSASGRYWTGTRWVNNWTYLALPVSRRTGKWSYSHPRVRGSLYISSRAVDDSGNVQSPPATLQITVDADRQADHR